MLKRTLSGACFVAVITGFFLLKEFVDSRLFSVLIYFCSAVGTIELARALKEKTDVNTMWLSIVYGLLFIPSYAVMEYFVKSGIGIYSCLIFALLTLFINVIFCFLEKTDIKALLVKSFAILYPAFLFLSMVVISNMVHYKSLIGLLLIFSISPLTDTFAYLVGMAYNKIKKGNAKKLCPKLSPKKTWAGAIGGILGGILGGMLVYLIFKTQASALSLPLPLLMFAVFGFVGAILTQIGDLFESAVKRKVGIKDMGKIMPGHGGILDRFDGMLFNSVFVCVLFLII